MPVWHVSISLQRQSGSRRNAPRDLERRAVALLRGVGGDREWWYWNAAARIGHLRVAMTADEYERLEPWSGQIDDAGEAGDERPRTP